MKTFIKRVATLFYLLTIVVATTYAVPAYRGWQTKTQPDGTTINVRQIGDEFYHYWETQDGKIAQQQEDGTFIVTNEEKPSTQQLITKRKASKKYAYRVRKIGAASMPARALFILVSFSDQAFKTASATYYKEKLGDATEGAMSMYNYLKLQSNGQYAPPVDVFGPVTLSNTCSYYGSNDSDGDDLHPAEMIVEACKALDSEIDFSLYDNNNDGVVDNVYVLYAGKGEADGGSKTTIWPHQWDIYSAENLTCKLDGKSIRAYACSAELNGSNKCAMGTPLHEFGHVIGLPDYYDTQYESTNYTEARTPGEWSIMDAGSYNNDGNTPPNYSIFDKYFLGWATPKFLAKDEVKNVTMTTDWDDAYQINGGSSRVAATNTKTVYYIENRQKSGWDAYLPGHGMIVWQVKYNATNWEDNDLNNTGGSPRYTVLSASGDPTNIGKASDPFPGTNTVRTFKPFTGCELTEITESSGSINFKYNGGIEKTEWDYVLAGENCTYPADGTVAKNAALSLTITPNTGYSLADASCWEVTMGGNTLTYGSGFTYNASTNQFAIAAVTGDVEIMVSAGHTVSWIANGTTHTTNIAGFDKITVPTTTPDDCAGGKKFVGWCTNSSYENATTAPTFAKTGDTYSVAKYYAVYATTSGTGGEATWNKVTDASTLAAGDVLVFACESEGKTAGAISSQIMAAVESTFGDGTISSLGSGTVELTLGGTEDAWTLTSDDGLLGATAVKKVAWGSGTTTWSISIESGNATIQNGTGSYGRFLYNRDNPRFTTYTSNPSASMILPQLYRKTSSASYSDYSTTCTTCELTSISINTDAVTKSFVQGAAFTAEGLVVTAHYADCADKAVTATVTAPDMTTAGTKQVTVSYIENEVTKTASYNITVTEPVKYTVTWNVNGVPDQVQYTEGDALVLPTTPENCSDTQVFVGWTANNSISDGAKPVDLFTEAGSKKVNADITYYAVFATKTAGSGSAVSDTLTNALIGISGTNYTAWTGKTANSSAVYAGQSAGGNSAIQLRSSNNNSGIVTTTSGGKATKIEVAWNSNTSAGRTTNIYGSNSAYESAADLYNSSKQGTLLGTCVVGTSTELTIDDEYKYIGIRSASGALYLDKVIITWGSGSATTTYSNYTLSCEEIVPCALTGITLNTEGVPTTFTVGDAFNSTGLIVTAAYSNCDSKNVTATVTAPDMTTVGTKQVTVSYTENEVTKTASYNITVNELPVVNTYTVTWHACDGNKVVTYNEGDPLVLPATPAANAGKAFYGWTTTEHYTGATAPAIISAGGAVNADADYYAVYK